MNEGKPLIEQADADFYKQILRLRKLCWREVFGTTQGCWCFNYYGDGKHYNCSECRTPTEFDKKPKEATGATATPALQQSDNDYFCCYGVPVSFAPPPPMPPIPADAVPLETLAHLCAYCGYPRFMCDGDHGPGGDYMERA